MGDLADVLDVDEPVLLDQEPAIVIGQDLQRNLRKEHIRRHEHEFCVADLLSKRVPECLPQPGRSMCGPHTRPSPRRAPWAPPGVTS